jgi:hypothetical protein
VSPGATIGVQLIRRLFQSNFVVCFELEDSWEGFYGVIPRGYFQGKLLVFSSGPGLVRTTARYSKLRLNYRTEIPKPCLDW